MTKEPTHIPERVEPWMCFVFTGQLAEMTRAEAMETVRHYGARAAGAIIDADCVLVVGPDTAISQRKIRQAEIIGALIITEAQFMAMVVNGDGHGLGPAPASGRLRSM